MYIFFGNTQQYVDHLLPLYNSYQGDKRFVVQESYKSMAKGVISYKHTRDLTNKLTDLYKKHRDTITYVVSSYGNLKLLSHTTMPKVPFILIEHGAGQTYITDAASWSRGVSEYDTRVKAFLGTNKYCVDAYQHHHPDIPCYVCGCSKLDDVRVDKANLDNPLIVFSWHWDCSKPPETAGGFNYWKNALPSLAQKYNIAIHGHPRLQPQTEAFASRNNLRFIKNFSDVLAEADIYACDNSSTLFEFAAFKPVIVLNNPWYRRDVEHGMRFWEFADMGVNCDDTKDLAQCIDTAKTDTYETRRAEVTDAMYPYLGTSTKHYIKYLEEMRGLNG